MVSLVLTDSSQLTSDSQHLGGVVPNEAMSELFVCGVGGRGGAAKKTHAFSPFDTGVQRFIAMRATGYDHFKPTPKSAGYGLGLVFIPIALYAWLLKSSRDKQEHKYRTGQVAYRDRRFKFI
uniref:NADH dehydrogenase [ubiquinone] 1 beta subcomplex subunit 4 n=1 Tax=Timema shepardi TaxID=629360 RepID=A0A7R9AYP2_TIMSH|nr:unnamed protein product [Timema shepardi]